MNVFASTLLKAGLLFCLLFCETASINAQDPAVLLQKVKVKLDQVKNYSATAKMKTDVAFLNVPVADVQVYYKNPDQFRIKKTNGISMMPKGGMATNFSALMADGRFVAVPASDVTLGGTKVKVVKLLPTGDKEDIILTTLFIDEQSLLIKKAITNTKENGTFEMDLFYGRFADWGLPDKVSISFSTKDYKLPKGITFDYESASKPNEKTTDTGKGKVEITYQSYSINKGVANNVFTD